MTCLYFSIFGSAMVRLIPYVRVISHLRWYAFRNWRAIHDGTKTGVIGEHWETRIKQLMTLVRETVCTAKSKHTSGVLQRLKAIPSSSEFEARIVEKTYGHYRWKWLFDVARLVAVGRVFSELANASALLATENSRVNIDEQV